METKGSLVLNSQAFRISGDLRPCHCTKASLNPRRAENCILDIVTSVINKIDRLCSWPFAFTVLASTRASSFDIVSPTSHNPYSLLPPSSNPPQFAPSNVVHHQRGESLPSPQAQSPRRGWSRRYKHQSFSHPPPQLLILAISTPQSIHSSSNTKLPLTTSPLSSTRHPPIHGAQPLPARRQSQNPRCLQHRETLQLRRRLVRSYAGRRDAVGQTGRYDGEYVQGGFDGEGDIEGAD